MKEKFHRLLRSKPFLIGILILGFLILIYPLISDRYYRIAQNQAIELENEKVQSMSKEERARIFEMAKRFNEGLLKSGGSQLLSSERLDYLKEALEQGMIPKYFLGEDSMGTLEIPKIKVLLPIFYGTGEEVLKRSLGYMPNTSLPIGGSGTHSIITGHRGLPESRLFRDLGELTKKDIFTITVLGEIHAYEVDDIAIIGPRDVEHFMIDPEKDEISLLTCHPYMINSERLIVKGHRVAYTPELKKKLHHQRKKYQWKLFLVQYREYLIGIGIFICLMLLERLRRKRKS